MSKNKKTVWEDLISQPISNGFKIGGLVLGIAYLWLFSQLAPTLRDVAVIQNDITTMKSDIAEVKEGIKDINNHLLSESQSDKKQAVIPSSKPLALNNNPVLPAPTPAPTPIPEKDNGKSDEKKSDLNVINREVDNIRQALSDILGVVKASN